MKKGIVMSKWKFERRSFLKYLAATPLVPITQLLKAETVPSYLIFGNEVRGVNTAFFLKKIEDRYVPQHWVYNETGLAYWKAANPFSFVPYNKGDPEIRSLEIRPGDDWEQVMKKTGTYTCEYSIQRRKT